MPGMDTDWSWWDELVLRTGARRGVDFDPLSDRAEEVLRELAIRVQAASNALTDPADRRWLVHALTASAEQVRAHDPVASAPDRTSAAALAVVTGPRGVLAGRRRDGVPPWVFPGGKIEPGESPGQAAVREVWEECRLVIEAGTELGRRRHPTSGHEMIYVACRPADPADDPVVNAPCELVEVQWLRRADATDRMPDLYGPVRVHLERIRDA